MIETIRDFPGCERVLVSATQKLDLECVPAHFVVDFVDKIACIHCNLDAMVGAIQSQSTLSTHSLSGLCMGVFG